MCAPAPTETPTTALISDGVRSGQASLGGAAAAEGAAAAATMKMAVMIAPKRFFEPMWEPPSWGWRNEQTYISDLSAKSGEILHQAYEVEKKSLALPIAWRESRETDISSR
jgi:hypothetical protein